MSYLIVVNGVPKPYRYQTLTWAGHAAALERKLNLSAAIEIRLERDPFEGLAGNRKA